MVLYSCSYVIVKNNTTHTTAVQSISIQLVPCVTATDEASNGVIATVLTATICNVAFIDVYNIHGSITLNVL